MLSLRRTEAPYKASIPLIQATSPEADILLAYEMNGETLNRDHGYPLRVVVPGGLFMQKDYKMFPPSVNWYNINWSTRRPQMDFPVQCVICSLEDVNAVKLGKVSSICKLQYFPSLLQLNISIVYFTL
ncbi:putative sulfite oxidase [Rosa chinensis]|uniref:Putative sulfite oxidase n=1 Tax=Rosa chinensis TaxID=74649 RepID=A0A2P6RWD2_ROSCH|nr:putative sulfite oxidase [Rosa chinensis]